MVLLASTRCSEAMWWLRRWFHVKQQARRCTANALTRRRSVTGILYLNAEDRCTSQPTRQREHRQRCSCSLMNTCRLYRWICSESMNSWMLGTANAWCVEASLWRTGPKAQGVHCVAALLCLALVVLWTWTAALQRSCRREGALMVQRKPSQVCARVDSQDNWTEQEFVDGTFVSNEVPCFKGFHIARSPKPFCDQAPKSQRLGFPTTSGYIDGTQCICTRNDLLGSYWSCHSQLAGDWCCLTAMLWNMRRGFRCQRGWNAMHCICNKWVR